MNEHFCKCGLCDRLIDMRDLMQVFSHDILNPESGKHECKTDEEIAAMVPIYTSSKKVGEPIEYTNDKIPITLN